MPRFDELDPEGRLFVTELESVGLVAAGANGPSDILITKTKTVEEMPPPEVPAESSKGLWKRILDKLRGDEAEKARNAGEFLESQLHAAFTMQADDLFGQGFLSREERIALSGAVGRALDAFRLSVEENAPHLYERDPFDGPPAVTAGAEDTVPKEGTKDRSTTEEVPMPEPITLDGEVLDELPEDVQKYISQLEDERDEAVSKGGEDASADAPNDEEALLKDADPEIRELVEKALGRADAAEAKATEAESIAKAAEERRLDEQALAKAEETPLVAAPDEFAPMLRKIEDALDEDEVAKFHTILKSAQDRIETGALYDELGRVGMGSTSKNKAEAEADAKAKELAAKEGITFEAAYTEIVKSDKDLAERLYAESRDTARGGAS